MMWFLAYIYSDIVLLTEEEIYLQKVIMFDTVVELCCKWTVVIHNKTQ